MRNYKRTMVVTKTHISLVDNKLYENYLPYTN